MEKLEKLKELEEFLVYINERIPVIMKVIESTPEKFTTQRMEMYRLGLLIEFQDRKVKVESEIKALQETINTEGIDDLLNKILQD